MTETSTGQIVARGDDDGAPLTPLGRTVRAMLVVNPAAGPGLWPGAKPAADRLLGAGWLVDVIQTEHGGHATLLARAATADGYDVVIGCGGDGTLSELAQGLAGSRTALGVVPTGTANVLARELGIPLDPAGAAGALLDGRVRTVDLGWADGRAFLLMAGVGLDADVVREVAGAPRRPPRWLKAPLLLWGTLRRVLTYDGPATRLTIDGQQRQGRVIMVVIGNVRSYAGVLEIAHAARWDDGVLDVVVFYRTGLLARLGNLLSVLVRRHAGRPGVAYYRARRIHIDTDVPVPVQADGDIIGDTPMTFRIEPRALRVVLPRSHG